MAVHYEEKMSLARAQVMYKAPYFAAAVYGFIFQAVPGIRTMLVTRTLVLGFDPQWADEATIAHLASDIFHEVNHFVRRHFMRAGTMDDPELWNIAGDLAINQDMRAAGWDMHHSYIYPEDYGLPLGKSTEEYYDLLKKQKQANGGKLQPKPRKGAGEDGTQAQPGQGPPGQTPSPGQQPGAGGKPAPGQPQSGAIGCGGCGGIGGHSSTQDIEAELNNEPDLGRTAPEIQAIEQRVAADIRAHAEAHGRGSVPANLLELMKAFEDVSYIRWEDELANVLRDATGRMQSGGDDFSLARPNKRSIMRGVIRPSMVEYLPEVAFIRDSSGSMQSKQLMAACREAYAVVQALGIDEVWFVDADTRTSMPWKRVGPEFFRTLTERHGGGGTDFNQPIASALQLTPRPDILVYLTDGDGSVATCAPPDIGVVWCIVPSHYNRAPARWGHAVIISDDPKMRNKAITYPGDDDDG